jgi:hypothetical protein
MADRMKQCEVMVCVTKMRHGSSTMGRVEPEPIYKIISQLQCYKSGYWIQTNMGSGTRDSLQYCRFGFNTK